MALGSQNRTFTVEIEMELSGSAGAGEVVIHSNYFLTADLATKM